MSDSRATCGLVLVAHGSSRSPFAAEPVLAAAERLAPQFRDVRVAFWKQQPSIAEVVATVDAQDVVIVPYFMADGWFVAQAIPSELGLAPGAIERLPATAQRVAYTFAVGSSTAVPALIERAVLGAVRTPRETAVVVVGHGTERDSASRQSLLDCVEILRARNLVAEVVPAFIDDEPALETWRSRVWSTEVVVVPFFAGVGPHVSVDVPRALGLPPDWSFGARHEIDGVGVRYLWPLGSSAGLDLAVLDRVDEALAELGPETVPVTTAARQALDELVAALAVGPRQLGNVYVRDTAEGWSICAAVDADREPDELSERPASDALTIAGWREPFRPWTSTTDLPGGWRIEVETTATLREVLDVLVPAGIVLACRQPPIPKRSWTEVAAAQVGFDRAARGFELGRVPELVHDVCGDCARRVAWNISPGVPVPGGAARTPACHAPCRRIVSEAAHRVRRTP